MKPATFAETVSRVKRLRDNPAYALTLPLLKQLPLPNPIDIFSPENYERILLVADKELWNTILQHSIMSGVTKLSSGDAQIDMLEEALNEGADFHDIIKQLR